MNQHGFTLIEVMVVIAIVAVLSAIAVPGYQNYIRKAALIDVLRTVTAFKTGVELCSFDSPSFAGCNSGQGSVPAGSRTLYQIRQRGKRCCDSSGKQFTDCADSQHNPGKKSAERHYCLDNHLRHERRRTEKDLY